MHSRFDRRSHLRRLGTSAGIGALAIITGACSEGTSTGTDSDLGGDPGGPATESEAAPRTDSDAASTDADTSEASSEAARTDSDAARTDAGESTDGDDGEIPPEIQETE